LPRDDSWIAGARSQETDLPVPGPEFPADRCRRREQSRFASTVSDTSRLERCRRCAGLSEPRHLLMCIIAEGATMAIGALALGLAAGLGLAQMAGSILGELKMPGVLPVVGSVLLLGAVTASGIPALRAARVDVMQALLSE